MARLPRATNPPNMKMAVEYYQSGKLKAATKYLKKTLASQPNNADANHLMGVISLQGGEAIAAIKFISRAIRANPQIALAHNNLGEAYRVAGRYSEAIDCYAKALTVDPNMAAAQNNMGVTLLALGLPEKSIACQKQALAMDPGSAMANTNLGNSYHAAGQVSKAVACYRQALSINASYRPALTNLGATLVELGEWKEAGDIYRRSLASQPGNADVLMKLGQLAEAQGKSDEALAHYDEAAVAAPKNAPPQLMRGKLLQTLGMLDEAMTCFKTATELDPGMADSYSHLGVLWLAWGDTGKAVSHLKKAIRLDAGSAERHVDLGDAFLTSDRKDEAIECYRRAISLNPLQATAHRLLSTVTPHVEMDDDIKAMIQIRAAGELTESQRMEICYGLGKAFEDLGDYDRAYEHLAEANELQRKSIDYSHAATLDFMLDIRKTFTPELLQRHANSGHESAAPIFVVGMPRSGTTLVEQILASHSQVYGAGELYDLETVVQRHGARDNLPPYPQCSAIFTAEDMEALGKGYIKRVQERAAGTRRFTDKLPGNFMRIGLIRCMLPAAKIIHCRRNAIDTCLSLYRNFMPDVHGYSCDLTELGQYYRLYDDVMQHWNEVLPDFVYDIDYEKLVGDQEAESRRLLDYCGLAWEDNCLEFYKTKNIVMTLSAAQVRRPIYGSSVNLWEKYASHISPLRNALGG